VNSASSTHVHDESLCSLRADTVAEGVAIILALTAFNYLIGFARGLLLCRWLDPAELGQWDMVQGFLWLAAPIAVLSIPGSFCRYVEHYRQQGMLRAFLRSTVAVSASMALVVAVLLWSFPRWLSHLLFGTPEHESAARILAWLLVLVIANNYLLELFQAMRLNRVMAAVNLCQSCCFALLACLLMWRNLERGVMQVLTAFALSYGVALTASVLWVRRQWYLLPRDTAALKQRALWSRILPFAFWVWVGNWMANLFGLLDRAMILHWAGLGEADALVQLGNYHSARLLPLVMVSVAGMLATTLVSHLIRAWDDGDRARVDGQINLALKLCGVVFAIGCTALMWLAPWLFTVVLRDRLAGGLAVLPGTMTYSLWAALVPIAQLYLWLHERGRLSSVVLGVSLLMNVVLNLHLLPSLGIAGAVLSKVVAYAASLGLHYVFCAARGMRLGFGTILISGLPALFVLGPWINSLVWAGVCTAAWCGDSIFTRAEKQLVSDAVAQLRDRLVGWRARSATA
jgi:O-antigen/teichoic acid export membrane protein